jgi:hypothetical protein
LELPRVDRGRTDEPADEWLAIALIPLAATGNVLQIGKLIFDEPAQKSNFWLEKLPAYLQTGLGHYFCSKAAMRGLSGSGSILSTGETPGC